MNASRFSTYARLALLAIAASSLSACVYNNGYHEPGSYYEPAGEYYGNYYGESYGDHDGDYYGDYDDYWYYPAVGAYYDPRVSLYFYYEHDHWVRARELPRHYHPHLGRHVVVRSPHDRPYAEHHRHRERYAPDRYRDERHMKPAPDRRNGDVWIGAPRRPEPERDHYERRRYDDDRNGNGTYRERERERERQPAHLQPKKDREPVRVIRKEPPQERYRDDDARRGNGRERDATSSQPRYRDQKQIQQPKARTQDMPRPATERPAVDHRQPAAKPETRRQQEKAQAHGNGKGEARQDKRQDDARRNGADRNGRAESGKQPGKRFEQDEAAE